jgi:glycosyltransferase involved in cell wall biosynthesis
MEKGFGILVGAMDVLASSRRLGGLTVTIQTNLNSADEALASPLLAHLRRLDGSAVRLLDGPLDQAAYQAELTAADMVLLPYIASEYGSRTSGPFAEALAAGKPVIVPRATWMSDQLHRFGAGLTFADGDAVDLARAITEGLTRIPELAGKANLGRAAWLRTHNPASFVDHLLDAAGWGTQGG